MRVLKWSEISLPGEEVNIAYATQAGADWQRHTHDFFEIFRVDSGRGLHVLGSEQVECPLEHGHVVFVRPADQHGFRPLHGSEPFAIVNVAFPAAAWRSLRDRYALHHQPFFCETGKVPPAHAFRAEVDQRVADLFQGLLHAPRNSLTRIWGVPAALQEASCAPGRVGHTDQTFAQGQGVNRLGNLTLHRITGRHSGQSSGCAGSRRRRSAGDLAAHAGNTPSAVRGWWSPRACGYRKRRNR